MNIVFPRLCAFVVVCKCGKRDSRDVHSCHTLTRLIASLVVIIVIIITVIIIVVRHYRRCNCYHMVVIFLGHSYHILTRFIAFYLRRNHF